MFPKTGDSELPENVSAKLTIPESDLLKINFRELIVRLQNSFFEFDSFKESVSESDIFPVNWS